MRQVAILVGLCSALAANAFGRGVTVPVEVSQGAIEGRPVLVFEADVAWPDTNPVGYSSIAIPVSIAGSPDERYGTFMLGCYNALEGDVLRVDGASLGGVAWTRESGNVVFDVTRFFALDDGRARLKCVVGDLVSDAVVLSIDTAPNKSLKSTLLQAVRAGSLRPNGPVPGNDGPDVNGRVIAGRADQLLSLDISPNPFNSSVAIRLIAEEGQRVSGNIAFYNIRGERVFADTVAFSTSTVYVWHGRADRGRPVASGVYFVVLTSDSGEVTARGRVALVK